MFSRRAVLIGGLQATAGLALSRAQQGSPKPAGHAADEMTANTQQQKLHFPPYEFGPVALELPRETLAVSGPGSLPAHARRAGLLTGSAVRVDDLLKGNAYAALLREQCEIVVSHVEMKWVALRPSR